MLHTGRDCCWFNGTCFQKIKAKVWGAYLDWVRGKPRVNTETFLYTPTPSCLRGGPPWTQP